MAAGCAASSRHAGLLTPLAPISRRDIKAEALVVDVSRPRPECLSCESSDFLDFLDFLDSHIPQGYQAEALVVDVSKARPEYLSCESSDFLDSLDSHIPQGYQSRSPGRRC